MTEFDDAKAALAGRESAFTAAQRNNWRRILSGQEFAALEPLVPSLGDAYDQLLAGMNIGGEEFVEHVENEINDLYRALGMAPWGSRRGTPFTQGEVESIGRGLMCQMAMLWHLRTVRAETYSAERWKRWETQQTMALGWLSSELAARAGAWDGNAPDWFPQPPEWLELWTQAWVVAGQQIEDREHPEAVAKITFRERDELGDPPS